MKNGFQAAVAVIGIVTIPVISFISMSAFAAPVTHQDQGGCRSSGSSTALSAFRGPENLRFQAVSNWLFQVSWLLTSPLMAHGVGSKDVDNCYKMLGGAVANQASWFYQPQCWFTAPASSYVKIFSGMKATWSFMM